MPKYVGKMDEHGRIQLPEQLRRSIGWGEAQWYSIEQTNNGLTLKLTEEPKPAEAIRQVFAEHLRPLGDRRGETHNQYVSRWRHTSGAVVVNENGQPNIWMTIATANRIPQGILPGISEIFSPGSSNPGFHSNVASTPGLNGETVVKFRAGSAIKAERLASMILENLEKHP